MCVIGSGGFAHFAEYLTWLMGYETLCYALFDQRDLVAAIAQRLIEMYRRDRPAHPPVQPGQGHLGQRRHGLPHRHADQPDGPARVRPARSSAAWPSSRMRPAAPTCSTRAAT